MVTQSIIKYCDSVVNTLQKALFSDQKYYRNQTNHFNIHQVFVFKLLIENHR